MSGGREIRKAATTRKSKVRRHCHCYHSRSSALGSAFALGRVDALSPLPSPSTRCEDVRERGGSDADAAAAIRRGWEQLGQEASRLGTALHLHAELHANGVVSVTDAPLELQREAEQFGAFLRSKFGARLQALRTELAVAWRAEGGRAVTAGQVDCLYKDSEGCVIMVDFKRVASKHSLEPWARAFGGAYGRPPVELLPDTPFWRYSLQQSLY